MDEALLKAGIYPNLAIPPGVPAWVVKEQPKRTYDEYARMLESGEWEVDNGKSDHDE